MWDELKEKVIRRKMICHALRVEWQSDGESGKGELTDIDITDDYINFIIRDDNPEVGVFEMGSARSMAGLVPDEEGRMRISSSFMGEIVILLDKEGDGGR